MCFNLYRVEKMMRKVLLVDDTVSDRTILRYNFGWYGYTVLEAGNGLEGLELASVQRPDLIVSDALMPVMDGYRFLQAVKEDPDLRPIPFIFYSAVYTGRDEEQLALKMGAMAFIVKPKGREEFWTELSNALIPPVQATLASKPPCLGHADFIKEYNQIVACKLEEKVKELEAANPSSQET